MDKNRSCNSDGSGKRKSRSENVYSNIGSTQIPTSFIYGCIVTDSDLSKPQRMNLLFE